MSNKITRADRRFIDRSSDDANGNPESLAGKINPRDIGSRATHAKVEKDDLGSKIKTEVSEPARKQKKGILKASTLEEGTLLQASGNSEGLNYFPRTAETQEVFDLIMSWVQSFMEDVPHDTIRSAADAILTILKDDNLVDKEKKSEVEDILGTSVANNKYSELSKLSRRITDYIDPNDEAEEQKHRMEEDTGVAVTFEGSDDDDMQEDSDDDVESDDEPVPAPHQDEETKDIDEETEVIGGAKSDSKKEDDNSIPAHEIDAHWIQRQLGEIYTDAFDIQQKTTQIFDILSSPAPLSEVENEIMGIFDFEHFELTKKLCKNREKIVWLTRLARASSETEKSQVRKEISDAGLLFILQELSGESQEEDSKDVEMTDVPSNERRKTQATKREPQIVDLDALVFEQGHRLNNIGELKLPEGTTRSVTKTYEEYNVPPPRPAKIDAPLVSISSLPKWTHPAFSTTKSLNPVQSKVFPSAFESSENLLLCAPTGAGKTNVALLTILETISHHLDLETNQIDLDAFKIVYISPLKALVQEQVREFSKKLSSYGINVAELSGDRNLTKQQISETQMIVTTPEKWDVITRKSSDTSYTNLVRLIIIDEIHLLHDERGPVLENIVARTIRHELATKESVRLVGLSATLPNYKDVATFLRVDFQKGLFFFDSSYRPTPLAQSYVGITERKAFKRYQAMNDACYDKVLNYAGQHQVIIFVHSRKETAKTARHLRDKAAEEGTLRRFLKSDSEASKILSLESESVQNSDLKDLMPTGFAIHHAGLSRADRASAEDLFRDGHVQVLVSTATLAWGVNLPAHTVIIKGTQVYSPEKGKWTELSPQDVLQMLGRAGRPGYDKSGDGVIITSHTELSYYMSLINASLPIESQMMSKLVDSINAEVALGTISSRKDAVDWLGYTYLYVRMLKSPRDYRVGGDYSKDLTLLAKRQDLAHSALVVLHQNNLVRYDPQSGAVKTTELGRIASHFYISHTSMATYNDQIKPFLTNIEIFRIFAMSEEFKYIPVRQEEKLELAKLLEKAPIPIKETVEEPSAKINVLLQAYISRLRLDGFALMADMVYITQSAGRLIRAMYEIALRKGWASLTRVTLDLCKMVEKRLWLSNSPFRQFPNVPTDVIKRTEASQFPWIKYFDLESPAEVGQVLRLDNRGAMVYQMLQEFPRLKIEARFRPVTPTLLRIELAVTPDFTQWDRSIHGTSESYLLIVEDSDGENILYSDYFILRERYFESEEPHYIDFTVAISEPIPPNYFVSLISEKWMHCENRVVLPFNHLVLPQKFPPHKPIYDMEPISVSALGKSVEGVYDFEYFNKVQTQTFHSLFSTDSNVFIGASVGNGKTVCAEIALIRNWGIEDRSKAFYISPFQDQIDIRLEEWRTKFGDIIGGASNINKLTGEISADLKILEKSDLVLGTPTQWDLITRRWARRRNVQKVSLVIADDAHMVGGLGGAVYEVVVSRFRFMATQLELENFRIVALSVSLANAKDFAKWIGASSQSTFNFAPSERQVPLEVHLQSLSIPHHPSFLIALAHPAYSAIKKLPEPLSTLIYVEDRKQCVSTSNDLVRLARADGAEKSFLLADQESIGPILDRVRDESLKESLEMGIGYIYPYMEQSDKRIVQHLFNKKAIQVLLAARESCWTGPKANLVIVMGTQFYEGREHRYIDYTIAELLQMIGHASIADELNQALILTNSSKRDYYRKFLSEALPIESHMPSYLADALIPEISEEIIHSRNDCMAWIMYTYFYKRLLENPTFYDLANTSQEGISVYLSDLLDNTLTGLAESNMIELDTESEDSISPLNGAIISSYYNVSYFSMQTFILSLTEKTRLKGMLEIVTSATEFETLPIRTHEDQLLLKIHNHLPMKMAKFSPYSSHFKAFVLLEAHLSRISLPPDLAADQHILLGKTIPLLSACVDVLSGNGHLNATYAMDLSQMTVQAIWNRDSPLKQIPHFDAFIIQRCNEKGVKTVYDFLMIEDNDFREELLQIDSSDPRMVSIANFVNKYPSIELSYELESTKLVAEEQTVITIKVEREVEEDEEEEGEVYDKVESHFYPFTKMENWWLVVGQVESNQIFGIKRVSLSKAYQEFKLPFSVPVAGNHKLSVLCMCDSYFDVDKEVELVVDVEEAASEEEDEEEEE